MVNGKAKIYKIFHESPFIGEHMTAFRFVLLPYGNSYGDIPRNAGHGDLIQFINGDRAEILSVALCDTNSKLINLLALMRYNASFDAIYRAWIKRAECIGAKRGAVSDTQCLFLWHSKRII